MTEDQITARIEIAKSELRSLKSSDPAEPRSLEDPVELKQELETKLATLICMLDEACL